MMNVSLTFTQQKINCYHKKIGGKNLTERITKWPFFLLAYCMNKVPNFDRLP